ncbi:hypothetical protein LCGC14_0716130 [marine sediment metagenome]|uniref:Uncharacterized protein n=1 Tax=marine sediment metagenome TaxID=412755 RepID=A0A0F9QI22_9ZZZZ
MVTRSAASDKILAVLSNTEWLSTAQIRDRTGLNEDGLLDHLHALNSLWVVDVKSGLTTNGGYGYYWRQQ